MLLIMIVSRDKNSLTDLASVLMAHDDISLLWAESSEKALGLAAEIAIDLVIADERFGDTTGLELAANLLSLNPMINFASISSLSPEQFHEASEGLGILAQLPTQPGKEHAEELIQRLRHIKNLTSGV